MPRRRKDEHSLRQTAKLHDISPGYLSKRVREGKPAKGYDLTGHARFDEDGGIECFVFPASYEFPVPAEEECEDARENPSPLSGDGMAASDATDQPQVRAMRRKEEATVPSAFQSSANATTEAGSTLQNVATNTLTGFAREEPKQTVLAVAETVKLVGAPIFAMGASKYIYDNVYATTREAQPPARANPEGGAKDTPLAAGLWPVFGIGMVVFVGTDYTVRGDESLLMRGAQCLGQRLDRLWENIIGGESGDDARADAAGVGNVGSAQERFGQHGSNQGRLAPHRQHRAREGTAFDGWQSHSGDGAASPKSSLPVLKPSASESVSGPL